jgi:hypothetical protein
MTEAVSSAANGLLELSFLTGVAGLALGIAALAGSRGRPKWPGVLALFAPLVAIIGFIGAIGASGPVS